MMTRVQSILYIVDNCDDGEVFTLPRWGVEQTIWASIHMHGCNRPGWHKSILVLLHCGKVDPPLSMI